MLESMSIKQGIRFNSPNSVREIEPFIAFHNLPMSEVLEPMSSFSESHYILSYVKFITNYPTIRNFQRILLQKAQT